MNPFPVDFFPEPVRSFIAEGAAALDCDATYVALPTLVAIAGAIGNSRVMRLKRTWREPAIIWAVPIGDSGTLKTPAMKLAMEPIYRRQKRLLKMHAKEQAAYRDAMKEWKSQPKDDRGEEPEAPPPCQHIFCSDVTVEGLADRLHDNQRGIIVAVDELSGWFARFDRYAKGGGGDVQHYLSMHSAALLKIDRKTSERKTIYVPYAAVSVCGGIQPGILRRIIGQESQENGLLARLLMAMPEPRPARWSDREISDETLNAMDRLYENLLMLKGEADNDGDLRPTDIALTDVARGRFIEFADSHAEKAAELRDADAAAWSKLKGYAARFALIHHLIRQAAGDDVDGFTADAESVRAGIALAEWFWEECQRIYHRFGESDEARHRRELLEWIAGRGGRVTVRDLQRNLRRYQHDGNQAEIDLTKLVDEAYGSWEHIPAGPRGGKPTDVFVMAESPDFIVAWRADADITPENQWKLEVSSASAVSAEPEMTPDDTPPIDDEWAAGFVAEMAPKGVLA